MKFNDKISAKGDTALLEMYKNKGNDNAFAELFARYIPLVYGVCLKYLENEADAQNAVRHIYKITGEVIKKRQINNSYTWLYEISKIYCLSTQDKTQDFNSDVIEPPAFEDDEVVRLFNKEKTVDEERILNYCINKLSMGQQKCIRLFFYDNKSYTDITKITGYTLKQVKNFIQNGKRNLKNCILKTATTNQ